MQETGFPSPIARLLGEVRRGKKPRKPPLPPTADELFAQAAGKPVGKSMQLPQGFQQLHPIAVDLMRTISAAKVIPKNA